MNHVLCISVDLNIKKGRGKILYGILVCRSTAVALTSYMYWFLPRSLTVTVQCRQTPPWLPPACRHLISKPTTAPLFPRLYGLKYTITAQRRVVISINNYICIHFCCTCFLLSSSRDGYASLIYAFRTCVLPISTRQQSTQFH